MTIKPSPYYETLRRKECRERRPRCIYSILHYTVYIFCCGWWFNKSAPSPRYRNSHKITRKEQSVYYLKQSKGSRNLHDRTRISNVCKNEIKVFYCSTKPNANIRKTLHSPSQTYLKPYFKRNCDNVDKNKPLYRKIQAKHDRPEKYIIMTNDYLKHNKRWNIPNPHQIIVEKSLHNSLQKLTQQKKRKHRFILSNILFSCLGLNEKQKEEVQDEIRRSKPKETECRKQTATCSKKCDSQCSLNSIHSIEIKSHHLTRSSSQISSPERIYCFNWKQRFREKRKNTGVLQLKLLNLTNKIIPEKPTNRKNFKQSNTWNVVFRMPDNFNNVTPNLSANFTTKDSMSVNANIDAITRPRNKICGLGEVQLKHKVLKLKESGRVRHVGVSNMNEEQLSRLCAVEKPACLQVEVHVLFQQKQLIATANQLGIPIVAYSPLGSKALTDALAAQTGRNYPSLLELPAVQNIAKAHSRTPAQVLLRYLLQLGVACIPKSTNPARIKQNLSLWDFELNKKEMEELSALDRGDEGRICDFSFFVGADKHSEFPFKKQ